MSAPTIITDVHGDRYAAVHVDQFDEWAWLLGRVEDWLRHAHDDTVADWAALSGFSGARIDDAIDTLGRASVRMRDLARGRP